MSWSKPWPKPPPGQITLTLTDPAAMRFRVDLAGVTRGYLTRADSHDDPGAWYASTADGTWLSGLDYFDGALATVLAAR